MNRDGTEHAEHVTHKNSITLYVIIATGPWKMVRVEPVSINPNGAESDLIYGCYCDMDAICLMADGWMKMLVEM